MVSIKIITGSTRPGRKGPAVAEWINKKATQLPDVNIELLDLKTIDLPFFDEPHHPQLKKYTHQHTKDWSAIIESADAYIFVIPEYNYSFTAPVKNALDFLYHEWCYKPAGFISYGGLAGGTRALQMLKQVVTTLKMVPLVESVSIPFFSKYITEEEVFVPDEKLEKSADAMLAELLRWARYLKPLKEESRRAGAE